MFSPFGVKLNGAPARLEVPSVKVWCFQTGRRSLMTSTRSAQAANASARWALLTAATSAASPIAMGPTR